MNAENGNFWKNDNREQSAVNKVAPLAILCALGVLGGGCGCRAVRPDSREVRGFLVCGERKARLLGSVAAKWRLSPPLPFCPVAAARRTAEDNLLVTSDIWEWSTSMAWRLPLGYGGLFSRGRRPRQPCWTRASAGAPRPGRLRRTRVRGRPADVGTLAFRAKPRSFRGKRSAPSGAGIPAGLAGRHTRRTGMDRPLVRAPAAGIVEQDGAWRAGPAQRAAARGVYSAACARATIRCQSSRCSTRAFTKSFGFVRASRRIQPS